MHNLEDCERGVRLVQCRRVPGTTAARVSLATRQWSLLPGTDFSARAPTAPAGVVYVGVPEAGSSPKAGGFLLEQHRGGGGVWPWAVQATCEAGFPFPPLGALPGGCSCTEESSACREARTAARGRSRSCTARGSPHFQKRGAPWGHCKGAQLHAGPRPGHQG